METETIDRRIEDHVNSIYNIYINHKTTPGQYVCPHPGCGKTYNTEESLSRHMGRHSTNKQHVCEYCGKAFLRKSECSIHKRIHTGEKPFECSICSKKFARATDLKIHLTYHSDEKPFACPFEDCHLRFKRKSDAKKHLRVHIKRMKNDAKMNLNGDFMKQISSECEKPISAFNVVSQDHLRYDFDGLMFVDY